MKIRPLVLAAAMVATTVVATPASEAVAPVGQAAARGSSSCDIRTYDTRIRKVDWNKSDTVKLIRYEVIGYPGKTTIKRGTTVTTTNKRNWSARVKGVAEATIGAEAILKKVIGIYGRVSGRTEMEATFKNTTKVTRRVKTQVKIEIPRSTSVAWYRGYRIVHGGFEYSWCHHYPGMPTYVGVKEWKKATFRSYGYPGSGGWRCNQKAQDPIAAFARKTLCN